MSTLYLSNFQPMLLNLNRENGHVFTKSRAKKATIPTKTEKMQTTINRGKQMKDMILLMFSNHIRCESFRKKSKHSSLYDC